MVREYAYNAREVRALVMTYGRMAPVVLGGRRSLGDRFSIVAKGPVTGLVVGLAEWAWSAADKAFVPSGEYMCGFRPAARTYYVKTGVLIERQEFSASLLARPLAPVPSKGQMRPAA
jgi:hypothetical protein